MQGTHGYGRSGKSGRGRIWDSRLGPGCGGWACLLSEEWYEEPGDCAEDGLEEIKVEQLENWRLLPHTEGALSISSFTCPNGSLQTSSVKPQPFLLLRICRTWKVHENEKAV